MKRIVHLITGMLLGVVLTTFTFAVTSGVFSAAGQDPVKLSPQYYKVLLENDQVRVLEYRLKPGEKEVMHSHPSGIVYAFSESKAKNTLSDGTVTESTRKAGDVFWRDPITHALENTGTTEVHSLAIELKNPCKK
jgi:quercetin dioxygenase-like cupin family protein